MERTHAHYYGDLIRVLFNIGGFIMIVSYPFFRSFITAPVLLSIIGCVILVVLAGLTSPRQKWIMAFNALISIIAFVIFEYATVYAYLNLSPSQGEHVAFFWVNQILALIFFFTSYLSTKTVRAMFFEDME
ncbi:hypothetical protein K8Q98_02455 [Candidatus Nomurabacteria bacterium]|nr:hypothetical protein [Candidatus Nomurabacteria bacterium]